LSHFIGGDWTPEEARDWFDRQRVRYLRMWVAS
jgi:hypothetical protein